ncbi:MAG: hypothetical protein ACOCZR_03180, partial [Halanaerobiales bacterium]
LIVLEENLDKHSKLETFITNLSGEYADKPEKQAEELLERYMTINSVDVDKYENISMVTKQLCLYHLSSGIERSHHLYFSQEGKVDILEDNK